LGTTLAKLVAKFAAGVVDTGSNFAAGVVDTGVVNTGGAPLLANISANFRKNSKRS
jgi:actin-like ATPase involved in cell morphogenesis